MITSVDNTYLTYDDIKRSVDWDWFKHLWLNQANEYQYFELAQTVRGNFTYQLWDRAWVNRLINHPEYKQARIEFINAILGWY